MYTTRPQEARTALTNGSRLEQLLEVKSKVSLCPHVLRLSS